jgi:hypothetical protein
LITQIIFGKENRSLRSSLCTFLHNPSYLIPLRLKYSPQHPIVTHPQPTFLLQCERPFFTPIQNNMQNAVYINLFCFLIAKILHWMAVSIPGLCLISFWIEFWFVNPFFTGSQIDTTFF